MNKDYMIQEILIAVKANSVCITAEMFIGLVFLTEKELKSICLELYIKTGK